MSSRAGRARRAWRGVAAATLATFVATVSHATVTGEPPMLPNLLLALGLAAPICVLLTGRAPSWTRLSIAVVLSQVLFHSLLALDLSGAGAGESATTDTMGGMLHHAASGTIAPVAASGHSAFLHGAESPWMWAAHAVAAALTILALGTGERALGAIAAVLADTFRALVPFLTVRPTVAPAPLPEPPLLRAGIAVLSVMRHRGPPLAA